MHDVYIDSTVNTQHKQILIHRHIINYSSILHVQDREVVGKTFLEWNVKAWISVGEFHKIAVNKSYLHKEEHIKKTTL